VFEPGDAFYLPPGHIGVQNEPGSEYVQFSPTKELKETSEVIMKNMQEMQGG
jgi:ribosomal protein L16 Arg81 hydroxylase